MNMRNAWELIMPAYPSAIRKHIGSVVESLSRRTNLSGASSALSHCVDVINSRVIEHFG